MLSTRCLPPLCRKPAGLGGILADDMGLGKTVQTLAHLMVDKEAGRMDRPCLIVCPTSVLPNWLAEARRFAPDLTVLPLHGATRKSRFKDIPSHDLVLSTYPLLTRDHEILTQQEWHAVILDEAQSIKNPNADTTRQALRLKARQRLCLSGTPLQNHLGELWSLFDFLAPGQDYKLDWTDRVVAVRDVLIPVTLRGRLMARVQALRPQLKAQFARLPGWARRLISGALGGAA